MADKHFRVGIIGAGFGGLGTAIRLKHAGEHDFVVFERDTDVGGTWHANTYPGAQCDIPSVLYSFSFAPNPHWTRLYPHQPEIKRYLQDCVERFGIDEHLRMGHDVTEAKWIEGAQLWRITTAHGATYTASVLVGASGPFSQPHRPDIDGLDSFTGPVLHSAQWDHGCELSGKRVAVVGTGASGVQLIPKLQSIVDTLVVFQRTPTWIMPHPDRPLPASVQRTFSRIPLLQKALRSAVGVAQELMVPGLVYRPALLRTAEAIARRHLRRQVNDSRLRETLTPHYRFGCKRPTFSNKYYPALAADNCVVETSPITGVTANGVHTSAGTHHEVDAIVLATGFTLTGNDSFTRIHGRDGTLAEVWAREDMTAHLGTVIAGFPNFYMILGPNSVVYTSQVVTIEAQVDYLLGALDLMRRRNLRTLEVRPEVQNAFVTDVNHKLRRSVWNTGGCSSYYLSPSGRNITFWPGFVFSFQHRMRHLRPDDFLARVATSPTHTAPQGSPV
ncbi:NAD(P)/FAD-dependent oxidoreductase [Mycobacterium sp. 852014-52144_SCH5372336]|uniref:flavin-containing monooxygenase n=1 Tax=Mycobacterium sp. 852014-52144_SCH5372336 TaxID=1834115 RepID=UPI0007FF8880|nr:NAD(P)/FAD-dependent oxidoreductase [Mycobacterium sp. 852014-52144_SCH5372336]OBB75893.1 cyclohexanone monooxygenase [Mycobacterium sp. 852014-52144_SCH5372336]